MSEEYGVAKVGCERVSESLLAFSERREFLKKVLKATIDEMIEEYEPKALFFGMTKGKWLKAERHDQVWHLRDKVYPYREWTKALAKSLGIEEKEVQEYFYNTDLDTYEELRELYHVSEDGYVDVGVEYARFINKWSPPDES